jgi:hypothetical protein
LSNSWRRLIPSTCAARVRFQPSYSSAWRITRRSVSARISFSPIAGVGPQAGPKGAPRRRQVFRQDQPAARENGRACDDVLQLADVARPRLLAQPAHRLRGQRQLRPVVLAPEAADEVLGQQWHVFGPGPQRRQRDLDHVEPVVQVFAEAALGDTPRQVAVSRRHHAHVDPQRLLAADALELPRLQGPQQLRLEVHAQLADLVEEQRAAVGLLEAAAPPRHRPGEGALLVTEQLALQQRRAEDGAVDLDERPAGAVAVGVDGGGDQLLAGAALAGDEDRLRGSRHPADGLEHLEHRGAGAHQLLVGLRPRPVVRRQRPHLLDQRLLCQCAADRDEHLVEVERLGDVVEGAQLHRLDGRGAAAQGRDDDDRRLLQPVAVVAQEVHAAAAGHLQVEQGQRQRRVGQGFRRPQPAAASTTR